MISFRLDRLATLCVASPVLRRFASRKLHLPVLMYHSVSQATENGTHPYYCTVTAPAVFATHMRYLHEHGYRTVNLPEAVRLLASGEPCDQSVAITFDDGYRDFLQFAFPALNQFGFTATVYLPTAYIGAGPIAFKGKDCLTWAEVRELRKHNIYFGSHTVTHPQLSTLDDVSVLQELRVSKQVIEEQLGEAIDSFSYPYAFPEERQRFTKMLREALINCGYDQGVSTRIGLARRNEDCYFLRRLPMNSLDDRPLFLAKLEGGYDWLYAAQRARKMLKRPE